jgi:hypothetical protein
MTKILMALFVSSALVVPASEIAQAGSKASDHMVQAQQTAPLERRSGPSNDSAGGSSTSSGSSASGGSAAGARGAAPGSASGTGRAGGAGEGTALTDKGETEAAAREQ